MYGPIHGSGSTEVEVELHLETKGPEHCAEVGPALREAGYTVDRLTRSRPTEAADVALGANRR